MKTLTALGATLLLTVASMTSHAAAPAPNRSVTYKSVDGVELKMDVFEPSGIKPADRRPAIVFFFGGGWSGGSTRQFYQQAAAMAEQGMVAFSADYRVKSRNKTTPFECVKDGKSAVRWVRQHAAKFGIDPQRIVAAGGSAGGHVAACTGVIEGHEEAGEDAGISSVPNAMILFNPVLDTTDKGYGAKSFKPDQQTELSPCHQVRKGIVPTIPFHGTADKTVPFENAERFTKLMKDAGNECVLVPFDGKDHGFFNGSFFRKANGDADYDVTMKRSIEFLKAHGILKYTDPNPILIYETFPHTPHRPAAGTAGRAARGHGLPEVPKLGKLRIGSFQALEKWPRNFPSPGKLRLDDFQGLELTNQMKMKVTP